MHSAFLETDDGWKLSFDADKTLEHDGNLFINEDPDEQEANLVAIGMEEGKFASCYGNRVLLTESELHWSIDHTREELESVGSALVQNPGGFRGGIFDPTYWDDDKGERLFRGVVAEKEGEFWRLRADQDKWEQLEQERLKRVRKARKKCLLKTPCKDDFAQAAVASSKEVGVKLGNERVDQLCLRILACDAILGKVAMNKHLKDLALKWCNDRVKSRKWAVRWVGETVVQSIDERLAAVCRLGSRNSRHKKRPA